MFKDNGSGQAEILQESHYYAFGMAMEGSWSQGSLSPDNDYLYNGKELDKDFGLDWYHYGARMYDPTIGVFTGTDRFAAKYAPMTPYQYGANNPISNIDINGDSIIVNFVSGGGKGGNDLVNIHVTGKVIDNTKKGLSAKKLEKATKKIIKGIEKAFQGSGEGIDFNSTTDISIAKSETEIKGGDHVFRLVDDVAKAKGITPRTGTNVLGEASAYENIVYLKAKGGHDLARTAAHELGHSASLAHIKEATEISPSGKFKPLNVDSYYGNLMHQTSDKNSKGASVAGYKVAPFQIRKIKKFYDAGLLNKGKQK